MAEARLSLEGTERLDVRMMSRVYPMEYAVLCKDGRRNSDSAIIRGDTLVLAKKRSLESGATLNRTTDREWLQDKDARHNHTLRGISGSRRSYNRRCEVLLKWTYGFQQ